MINKMNEAYFAGGCFWCTESVFQNVKGVQKVVSGYAGGNIKNPTYREICSGLTGHAELVKITFDSEVISYNELMKIFFATHDPTTLNRQGNDSGTQYRSAIFYTSEENKNASAQFISEVASTMWDAPIVTTLEHLEVFYEAEAYHQNYYNNHTTKGYCRVVIQPKLAKFKKEFQHLLI